MLHITVNGQPATQPAGTTVAALVASMALAGRRYAVERNGEVVPKSRLDATAIEDGDRFEIVFAVGGG